MPQTLLAFADTYLAPYRVRGQELIPELCPFCKGGPHGDRSTFALNIGAGVYLCKRGNCGAKGRFETLAQYFGSDAGPGFSSAKAPRSFTLPDTPLSPLTGEILAYFENRKISPESLTAYGMAADAQGNIVFPFRQPDGKLVYMKYRRPRKPVKGEPKEWQFPGTKPILFGMELCAYNQPLIVSEGQVDALSLYEAGARNVVSVPGGVDNLDWIEHCWDFLERFGTIILFGDNDEPGRRMVRQVARRLDEARCLIVEDYPARPDGVPCKDANEILYFLGTEALMDTLQGAVPVPLKGVIQ